MARNIYEKSFGYLGGSDAHENVQITAGEKVSNTGSTNIYRLRSREPENYTTLHITKNFFRQRVRYNIKNLDCLVNLVTDPDVNPKVLENIARLLRNYHGRVINHPARVLETTRDLMARRLEGTPGLIVPPTIRLKTNKPKIVLNRLEKGKIRFPAIVRACGSHTGKILGLFDRADQVPPALEKGGDYYVTSFIDFRSPDGLYRKYRVFFFGERIVFRHLLIGKNWNVHAADRDNFMAERPEAIAEEKRIFEEGLPARVMETLAQIRDKVGLDYAGVDFALTDKEDLILFEANATMNFFPFSDKRCFDYVKTCLAPSQEAFDALLYPPSMDVAQGDFMGRTRLNG